MLQKDYLPCFIVCFQKKSKFRKDPNDTELLFKKHLIKQFKKFIIRDGKYSSEIFGKIQGIFLERMKYKYSFDKNIFYDKIFFIYS